jgi:uncharacterized protein
MFALVSTTRVAGLAQRLPSARYILLATRRNNGERVATPVWFVQDGSRLLVWTDSRSAKVRRIHRDPRVTVSTCSFRGRPTSLAEEAIASILPYAQETHAEALFARRYGVILKLYSALTRLSSRVAASTYLAIYPIAAANEEMDRV